MTKPTSDQQAMPTVSGVTTTVSTSGAGVSSVQAECADKANVEVLTHIVTWRGSATVDEVALRRDLEDRYGSVFAQWVMDRVR